MAAHLKHHLHPACRGPEHPGEGGWLLLQKWRSRNEAAVVERLGIKLDGPFFWEFSYQLQLNHEQDFCQALSL